MGKKLYVGNLTYGVTDSALEQMFAQYGTVESAQVIMDRDTGRSKGFGFVEMGTDQEAQAAIAGLNGQMSGGRTLTVNEAKPREDRGGGGVAAPAVAAAAATVAAAAGAATVEQLAARAEEGLRPLSLPSVPVSPCCEPAGRAFWQEPVKEQVCLYGCACMTVSRSARPCVASRS